MSKLALCLILGVSMMAAQAQPQGEGTLLVNPHNQYVRDYQGTKTCLACHEEQAKQRKYPKHAEVRHPIEVHDLLL